MAAIKVSEANFISNEHIDFIKNKKLMIIINCLSIFSFALFYVLFFYTAKLFSLTVSSDLLIYFKLFEEQSNVYQVIFITIIMAVTVLHELIHGLFFYLYTGAKPVFGYKILYAYAGAPDWYIQKNYFYIISLSPLIIITIAGFLLLNFVPSGFASIVFLTFTANAAGCLGDIWITLKLIKKPADTYVNDSGLCSTISNN